MRTWNTPCGRSLAVLASLGSVLAMAGATTAVEFSSLSTGPRAESKDSATSQKILNCLSAVSKDICDGRLGNGGGYLADCSVSTSECSTLEMFDANWTFSTKTSGRKCSDNPWGPRGRCDEEEKMSGKFDARVNFELRYQKACRFRGCIGGEATYSCEDGTVWQGTITGVLGAGADRQPQCTVIGPVDPADCENCLDVFLDTSTDPNIWNIGVEVIYNAKRVDKETGETICLNISGMLRAKGDINGPFDPYNGFWFTGAMDGIHSTPCY